MAIYEKYTGRSRESFTSLEDCRENYKLTWNDDFNFAYDVIDELGKTKPEKLAEEIKAKGVNAKYTDNFEEIAEYVKSIAQEGDIIFTMGAGDVTDIGSMLCE